MKKLILLMGILCTFGGAWSQVLEINLEDVKSLKEAKKLGITKEDIQLKLQQSKAEIIEKLSIDNPDEVELKSINIQVAKSVELKNAQEDCIHCKSGALNISENVSNQSDNILEVVNNIKEVKPAPKGILFVTWGYNRGFHSKSDIKVETDNGTIIIRDAVGKDRPSKFSLEYLKPKKFSVPQYNFKLGYWFSKDSKFGLGIGTDHMKWVFDHTQEYDIEGTYNKPLWVNGQQLSFDEIKQGNNASFLLLEHTDGYNYPYIEGLYREKLIETGRFDMDFVAGAGFGILFPKTRTRVADREDSSAYRDVDNKFKVAGYGFHADVSLMLKYKQKNGVTFFVKPTVRGVAGKINNALYLGNDTGRISQSMIYTLEPTLSVGTEVPLKVINNPERRMNRREAKKLKKMKEADALEDKSRELSSIK